MADAAGDKTLTRRLGDHIRTLRVAAGWTQEDFADVCGVHPNYVGTIERGEQTMSLEIAKRIAQGLGKRLSSLLDEIEQ